MGWYGAYVSLLLVAEANEWVANGVVGRDRSLFWRDAISMIDFVLSYPLSMAKGDLYLAVMLDVLSMRRRLIPHWLRSAYWWLSAYLHLELPHYGVFPCFGRYHRVGFFAPFGPCLFPVQILKLLFELSHGCHIFASFKF